VWVHGVGAGSPKTPRQNERPHADACGDRAFSDWPGLGIFLKDYVTLVVLWALLGVGYSLSQTPSGRLLRRSSTAEDRPALFAAQFALSHSCWLVTYPLAGWVGATWGTQASFIALTIVAALSLLTAVLIWRPEHEAYAQIHSHTDSETNIHS
jgi:MFS family permease